MEIEVSRAKYWQHIMQGQEDGLVVNHHFVDLKGLGKRAYKIVEQKEDDLIARADAMGESIGYLREGDFDDDDFEDDVLAAIMREIDLGVKVTVAALSCVGCYPVTSCNGCAGHPEDHAVVAFWCPPKAWPLVRQAAVRTGVSVTSVDLDIRPGLRVFDQKSWRPLREFAKTLACIQ